MKEKPAVKPLAHTRGDAKPPAFDGSLEGLTAMVKTRYETVNHARARLVELLRGEDDMRKFVETADRLRKRKTSAIASLDDIAKKSGTNRSVAFGAIARVLHRYNFEVTSVIWGTVVRNEIGKVATTLANQARHPDNFADRKLFMDRALPRQLIEQPAAAPPVSQNVAFTVNANQPGIEPARPEAITIEPVTQEEEPLQLEAAEEAVEIVEMPPPVPVMRPMPKFESAIQGMSAGMRSLASNPKQKH